MSANRREDTEGSAQTAGLFDNGGSEEVRQRVQVGNQMITGFVGLICNVISG